MKNIKWTIVAAMTAIIFVCSCSTVAFTDRKRLLLYPDSEIMSLSEQSYKEFIDTVQLSTDKTLTAMVKEVGKNMTSALDRYCQYAEDTTMLQGLSWNYLLIKGNDVNAFCMPSGKIVFYEGIMPYTSTKDYIAVVMGHEIAHAIARHGNERMSQQAVLAKVGDIAGQLIGTKSAEAQSLFNTAFGIGGQYGILLPYSRKHEYEADYIGLLIMAMAGYDIDQAPVFWEKMTANKKSSSFDLLSTHPSDEKRIAQINAAIPEIKEVCGLK